LILNHTLTAIAKARHSVSIGFDDDAFSIGHNPFKVSVTGYYI